MKKPICAILVTCLLAGFCACGQVETEETGAATTQSTTMKTTTTEETTTERVTVTLNQNAPASGYYKVVLRGQIAFIDFNDEEQFLDEYLRGQEECRFTVLDLDGDGMPEVVFDFCVALRLKAGQIRMYGLPTVWLLKTDGSCVYDNAPCKWIWKYCFEEGKHEVDTIISVGLEHIGIYPDTDRLHLDGEPTTILGREAVDRFDEYMIEHNAKPAPEWLDFTEENIAKAFG